MSDTSSTLDFKGNALTVATSLATSDGGPITTVTLPKGKTLASLASDLGYPRSKDLSDAIFEMVWDRGTTGLITVEESS